MAEALRSLGAVVKLHDEFFDAKTKDIEWLPQVGAKKWVVLTRDKHILTRPLEVVALVRANTYVFILKSRQELNGVQMAAALVAAFPHMCKLIASHTPPFLRVLRSRAPSKRLRDTSNCNYGSSSSSCNCGYPCRQIAERILPLGAHVRDRQDFLADNEEQRVDGFDLRKLRRLIRVLRRSQILSLDGDKSKAIASQEALQQSIQHYSHSHSLLSNLILDESNQDRKVPTSEMRIPHAVSVDRMG